MGMSIQDLIANKQREMVAKKGRQNTLKPATGKHTYRVLPSWRGGDEKQFWHDFGQHFIRTQESADKVAAVYVCAEKTYGKPCEVCAAIRKSLAVSSDDKMSETLKKAFSNQRYLLNVLHLTGPEPDKVQIMEVGQGVFDSICEMVGEYGDITDPNGGSDIVIKREGSGIDTKYTVMKSATSKPVPPSALKDLPNLDDYVATENPTGELKALTAVGTIIGVMPSDARAALGSRAHPALKDLSEEAEEADFAPVTGASKAGAKVDVSDIDLDDLDDLDALLDAE